ncbi:MAG: penicillin-binding transpeptidase domain-containing protein [Pyrinomonadaceae bacterium]
MENRVIRGLYSPGSTFQSVMALADLNEGIINENGEIISRPFSLRLADALAYSNNVYFQRVGNEIGSEKFIAYAKMLGLGETTGINAEGESPGKLPYGNESLKIYSHGDDIEVTPLQLAVMVSAITNGGKIVVPQIAKNDVQKAGFTAVRREMNLPRKTLQGLLPGMLGAVAYGTAKTSDGVFYSVAGKTGSCIGQGSWLGLFASVAPAINPKYTVVVVTRGQAERGRNAAIIAGKIYQALFSKSKDAQTLLAESKRQISIPKPQVDAKLSMLLDGENEEANEILTEGVKRSRKISITKQRSIDDLLDEEGLGGDSPNLKTTVDSKNPTDSKTQKKNVVKPIIIEVKKPNLSKEGETEKTENEKKDESKKDSFTRPRIVKSSSRVME